MRLFEIRRLPIGTQEDRIDGSMSGLAQASSEVRLFKERVKPFVPKWFWPVAKSFYYFALRAYYYPGYRYICPVCGAKVRKLLDCYYHFPVIFEKQIVGATPGPVLCPVCRSLERTRLLYLYLEQCTDFFQRPQHVLHFAPEKMIELRGRKVSGPGYVTGDLFPAGLMVRVDITEMQFPDNSFDSIICCHVLEHVPDDRKAMRELYRVLKPGGWAIVQVPISLVLDKTYEDFSITSEAAREQAFGQNDHVRIYGADYKNRLEEAGFRVTVFRWTDSPEKFGGNKNKFALNEKEAIYRVDKVEAART